jgi:hypothetical protein
MIAGTVFPAIPDMIGCKGKLGSIGTAVKRMFVH